METSPESLRNRRPEHFNSDQSDNKKYNPKSEHKRSFVGKIFNFFWNIALFCAVCLAITAVFLLVIDSFTPPSIDPAVYEFDDPPVLTGPLKKNNLLLNSYRILENKVFGPESIVIKDGVLYTGTSDGKVMRYENGILRTLVKLGKHPCGLFENEPTCGRPLGLRFDNDGNLLVVDAYLGLFSVNFTTKQFTKLISSKDTIDGEQPKFLNDITISNDGKIFLTDTSTKWERRYNRIEILESQARGRIIEYDCHSKKIRVVKKGLNAPNGIQISKDNDYLLITETTRARIMKYHLKGPKKGTLEVFIENLPGLPDNIRQSKNGHYWIAFAIVRHSDKWNIYDFLGSKPLIREMMAKFLPQDIIIKALGKPYGLIIEIDAEGSIIQSLHDPSGMLVPAVSEVEETADELYLGSYFSPYITVVKKK